MKKIINFTEKTLSKVEKIKDDEGYTNFSATVIAIISQYYDKKFYSKWNKSNGSVEEQTPEQICENLGGTVSTSETQNPVCIIKTGGMTQEVPLDLMGIGQYKIK